MYCPRLKHFIRLNSDGSVGKCGHMTDARGFESLQELDQSAWLERVKQDMEGDGWAHECQRCQRSEEATGDSIRLRSIDRHNILKSIRDDYLIVGGTLDNICNSACQTCNAGLSTKIGSLESRDYKSVDNFPRFWELPLPRILELDINGGEPTASPNYKKVLANIPKSIKIVRMNTNGSRMIKELESLLEQGMTVIVTLSLDGTEKIHDYVRWPIKWKDYTSNVERYCELREKYKNLHLDFWTTVSCLNLNDFHNIETFAAQMKIKHNWAFLHRPHVLDVKYSNRMTENAEHRFIGQVAVDSDNSEELQQFIGRQDRLRQISIDDYYEM